MAPVFARTEDVVRSAYNLLLDREPEPAGLHHWTWTLDNGLSREEFVRAILASDEFKAKMADAERLTPFNDVDLIIPVSGHELRVPASDRAIVPYLLKYRCWEPHLSRYLVRELDTSDVLVDVGANVGYFTVLCAPLVKRVVAFEPVAKTYRYCQANVALNHLANVDLYPYGLWHENTTLSLRRDSLGVNAAVASSGDVAGADSINVVTLDYLVESGLLEMPGLDMVKLDVEGAELSVLMGMRATIARFFPRIVMELNRPMLSTFGLSVDHIWDFLRGFQYEIRAFASWLEQNPVPVADLGELKQLCPPDALIDIVASVSPA
jgi:FkbM family methyltransferase